MEPVETRPGRLRRVRLVALLLGLGVFVGAALWFDSPETYWVEVSRTVPESNLLCVSGSDIVGLDVQGARGGHLCGTYVEGGNGLDLGQLDVGLLLLVRVEEIEIGSARRTVLVALPVAEGVLDPE